MAEVLAQREAARRLGVTTRTVLNLIKSGELDAPYPGVVTLTSVTRVALTPPATTRGCPRIDDSRRRRRRRKRTRRG
jgi:excisionase family DNA binding protein